MTAVRIRGFLAGLVLILTLAVAACSSGTTEVTADDPTGPTETGPTGTTSAGATGADTAGSTGDAGIAGTWEGTWSSTEFDVSARSR